MGLETQVVTKSMKEYGLPCVGSGEPLKLAVGHGVSWSQAQERNLPGSHSLGLCKKGQPVTLGSRKDEER